MAASTDSRGLAPMLTNFVKFKEFVSYWLFRYELATNLEMAEPWEKCLVNVMVLLLLTLLVYSVSAVLPSLAGCLMSVVTVLSPLGSSEEVAVPVVETPA